ncbi:MAG: hypothetical protein WCN95_12905 [bacterium]
MNRILLVAGGLVCICAVSCQRASEKPLMPLKPGTPVSVAESNSFVHVASMLGSEDAALAVRLVLEKHGIRCGIHGTAVYSVDVAPANKAKAIDALKTFSSEYGFPVTFD